jgi:putative peptidoglycan lipid II flippase
MADEDEPGPDTTAILELHPTTGHPTTGHPTTGHPATDHPADERDQ